MPIYSLVRPLLRDVACALTMFSRVQLFDGELVVDLDRMFLLCWDIVFLALDMQL